MKTEIVATRHDEDDKWSMSDAIIEQNGDSHALVSIKHSGLNVHGWNKYGDSPNVVSFANDRSRVRIAVEFKEFEGWSVFSVSDFGIGKMHIVFHRKAKGA